MAKAYAYVRYSSTIQRDGDTVERQITPLEAFTERFGVPVVETFIDEGVSSYRGKNARSGKLKVILDRIDSGELRTGDYLVVESIDRITRQRVFDGVRLLQSILAKGVQVYTTADRKRYSVTNPSDDFDTLVMIAIVAKRANEESERKSDLRKKRWDKAKREAVQEGKIFNRHSPPYGLRYCSDKQSFVIDEGQASEIRQIFELLKVTGVAGALRIVNKTAGRKWTNKAVNVLLRTKYPLGVMMSQRRNEDQKKEFVEYIEGYYPQIVSHSVFNSAVDAMRQRATRKEYGNFTVGNLNIFRHVVKCGKCGESLLFEKQRNQKNEMYYYLHCKTKKEHKGDCDQRFRYDLALGMLLASVGMYQPRPKMIGAKKVVISKQLEELMQAKFKVVTGDDNGRPRKAFGFGTLPKSSDLISQRSRMKEFSGNLLSLLGSRDKLTARVSKEFEDAAEKLAGLQSRKINLEATVNASIESNNGAVPPMLVKNLVSIEVEIDSQIQLLQSLNSELTMVRMEVPAVTMPQVLEKLKTEAGRLEMNNFFKSKKAEFKFSFNSKSRELEMVVEQDGEKAMSSTQFFTLHKPLARFGIENLIQEMSSE